MQRFLLALAFALLTAAASTAQPAVVLDIGIASGGTTNDVQLTYGAGVHVARAGRTSVLAELFYVRDFFEPEPDDPLSDALSFSGVMGFGGTARVSLFPQPTARRFLPYLTVFAGGLRASRESGASVHPGLGIGAGLPVIKRRRWSLLAESRRFSALEKDGDDGFHFWRTTAMFEVALR